MSDWLKTFWLGGAKGGQSSEGQRYPSDDPEGVTGQYDVNGNLINTGAFSLNKIEILDLISEGPIEGPVSGKYVFSGQVGAIGYSGVGFIPFGTSSDINAPWLRSVYWNEVPVMDSDSKFNFSNIDISYSIGLPNGSYVGSKSNRLMAARSLGERLRGAYTDQYGGLIGNNEDYAKVYRILNQNCYGVQVNVKFGQLYTRNVTEKEYGDLEITKVEWTIEYKALFSDGRRFLERPL